MDKQTMIGIGIAVVGWFVRQFFRDKSAATKTTVARLAYLAAETVELAATHGLLGAKADWALVWEATFKKMLSEAGIAPTDKLVREAKPAAIEHFTGRARAQSPGTPQAKKTIGTVKQMAGDPGWDGAESFLGG